MVERWRLPTSRVLGKPHSEKKVAQKAKKPARRAWSKDDVKTLKAMARSRAGVRKIAKALKRTPGATTVKAAKLGISLSMS
jgi:hypothetical protein